jgi:hypothetical protein
MSSLEPLLSREESDKRTAKRLRDEAREFLERAQKKLKKADEIERTPIHKPLVKEELPPAAKEQQETIRRKKVGDILYSFSRDNHVEKYIITSVESSEDGTGNRYTLQICNVSQTQTPIVIRVNDKHMGKVYFDRPNAKTLKFSGTKQYRQDFLGVHIPDDLTKDHKIYYVENGAVYECTVTRRKNLDSEKREYYISGEMRYNYNEEATPSREVSKWINGNTPGAFGTMHHACYFASSSSNVSIP